MRFIGMVHLRTLPRYPQHKGMEDVVRIALADAIALQEGGADAILLENTYDDPHQKTVGPETVAAMTLVAQRIRDTVGLPLGICMLWNDYKASLGIARAVGAQFVRIPVFTEAVLTSSGMIEGNPYDAITYRNSIGANGVRILADVHVKHSTVLSQRPIGESAREALSFGADEVIITGKFTGDAPDLAKLRAVREACPMALICVGSGTTPENVADLARYADRFIVGTCLKNSKDLVDVEKVK